MHTHLSPAHGVDRFIRGVRNLHPSQVINEDMEKIENRIRRNPIRFRRAFSKAKAYAKSASSEQAFVVWIACHLFDLMEGWPCCFYCGMTFSDVDFLSPDVQLEHFIPRSQPPIPDLFGRLPYAAHHPHRIVLACANCNGIKSNHSRDDFRQITEDPEAFFEGRRYKPRRKEQLMDFAELYCFSTMPPQDYAEQHKIVLSDAKGHLETRRLSYRKKWQPEK